MNAGLNPAERRFLTFALDLAANQMAVCDGFDEQDVASLESLRILAAETAEPALDALRRIHADMVTARSGGDEWASEWLGEVWTTFPLALRAAAGDMDAAEELAADFFQPGHTYADRDPDLYDWRFRCDMVTTHPEDGGRIALGWRHSKGEWGPIAYGEGDYDLHGFVGTTDQQEAPRG
ncbi:hypothetical protein [Streptomyces anulatus]|uniref:hypothetical protein n=1 Tax=Streptomyces anulatus TaxID=1892 RepID=UPI0032507800